jgi:hypothetical protein
MLGKRGIPFLGIHFAQMLLAVQI